MQGGRGTPVVFIHGLGSSGYMEWRYNLEPFATRHRVLAPDLPGYGRTDKPRVRYTIPYFARFVRRYMHDCGLRSAAVIGASLGGRIALELALEEPKLVRKLVLVNTLGLGRPQVRIAQMAYGLVTIPRVGEAVIDATLDERREHQLRAAGEAPVALLALVAGGVRRQPLIFERRLQLRGHGLARGIAPKAVYRESRAVVQQPPQGDLLLRGEGIVDRLPPAGGFGMARPASRSQPG